MNPFEARALRDKSAAKTKERLSWDRERSSHRIRPLVAYIEERLFEPDLNYERIRAVCRIRDNNRTTLFRRELGLTPAAYIRDCRMEVACRLLRDTDMEVSWIAELVGYGGPQVFTPAFKRYAGVTPTWYRRRERPNAEAENATAGPIPDLNPSAWRRFVGGELASEEAAFLLRHFLDRYPEVRRRLLCEMLVRLRQGDGTACAAWPDEEPPELPTVGTLVPSLKEMLSREDVEELMAEVVWEEIQPLPWPEQVDLVRHHLRFSTPAFLRLLGEKSRAEDRSDRQVGIRIARLALEYAAAFGDGEAEDGYSPWKALAWCWIGNAKRLALDYHGAEKAFGAARRLLPERSDSQPVRQVAAELCMNQAMLRWDQRRLAEALRLVDLAVPGFRDGGTPAMTAQALMIRGLVRGDMGDPARAIADLQQALALVESGSESYLRYAARFNLARLHLQAHDTEAAAAAIDAARGELTPSLAKTMIEPILLGWLDGLLADCRAEPALAAERIGAARKELRARKLVNLAAVASLDLALLAARSNQLETAAELAAEAMPLFDALSIAPDAAMARRLFEGATETGLMTAAAAGQLRGLALRLARTEPALGLSRRLPHWDR